MKRVTLLLLLLIGIAPLSKANHRFEHLRGEYYNIQFHKKIFLKPYKHGVKVKGLPWKKGWIKFRSDYGRSFVDRKGNELVVRNNKIIIRSNWKRRPLLFVRNGFHHEGSRYDDSWTDLPRDRRDKYNFPDRRMDTKGNRLSGVWYNDRIGKALEIELTHDGLRSRFKDSNRWVYYHQIGQNEYEDERGNRLRHEAYNQLVWEDHKGRNRYYLSR